MYPARFSYHLPETPEAALQLLALYGDEGKLLAGGHSLIPMMKMRLLQPRRIIDLQRLDDLRGISQCDTDLLIGSMTTHYSIESSDVIRANLPMLAEAASVIADPLVRNRGTIGGSLVHGDPAADFPAVILALEGTLVCLSRAGTRTVAADDWFVGLMSTGIREDEILLHIRIPVPAEHIGTAYCKFPHPATHFAVVGAAAIIELDDSGRCARARIGLTGVGVHAFRAYQMESALTQERISEKLVESTCNLAFDGVDLQSDLHNSKEQRAALGRTFVKRAVLAATRRAKRPYQ